MTPDLNLGKLLSLLMQGGGSPESLVGGDLVPRGPAGMIPGVPTAAQMPVPATSSGAPAGLEEAMAWFKAMQQANAAARAPYGPRPEPYQPQTIQQPAQPFPFDIPPVRGRENTLTTILRTIAHAMRTRQGLSYQKKMQGWEKRETAEQERVTAREQEIADWEAQDKRTLLPSETIPKLYGTVIERAGTMTRDEKIAEHLPPEAQPLFWRIVSGQELTAAEKTRAEQASIRLAMDQRRIANAWQLGVMGLQQRNQTQVLSAIEALRRVAESNSQYGGEAFPAVGQLALEAYEDSNSKADLLARSLETVAIPQAGPLPPAGTAGPGAPAPVPLAGTAGQGMPTELPNFAATARQAGVPITGKPGAGPLPPAPPTLYPVGPSIRLPVIPPGQSVQGKRAAQAQTRIDQAAAREARLSAGEEPPPLLTGHMDNLIAQGPTQGDQATLRTLAEERYIPGVNHTDVVARMKNLLRVQEARYAAQHEEGEITPKPSTTKPGAKPSYSGRGKRVNWGKDFRNLNALTMGGLNVGDWARLARKNGRKDAEIRSYLISKGVVW